MTTATLNYKSIQYKISLTRLIKINWKRVYIAALACSLMLLVLYIFRVNELTQGAFLIKNYTKKIYVISQENKILESDFAESGLLGQVQERASQLGFKKTTQVTYIQMLQNSLAEAK